MWPRNRGTALALCLAIAGCLALGTYWLGTRDAAATTRGMYRAGAATGRSARVLAPRPKQPAPAAEVIPTSLPRSGPGTFRYATTQGPVLGRAGLIRRFRVAVESNLRVVAMARFAATVDQVLADPRGWIASGQVRFQRVPAGSRYDFAVYLATAGTTMSMCGAGGVGGTMGYTSCRYARHVVLNVQRWYSSVPGYVRTRAPLATYRAYMINHELGHELGHGHELCPGPGRAAPVMQQQTLGLHRCLPNAWPYLGGRRYAGAPGQY